MWSLGCRAALTARARDSNDALVVLAFGRPRHERGRYGASLFRGFASVTRIGRGAVAYAMAFAKCDRSARAHLELALGTSNFGDEVDYGHGQAWATMVNRVNDLFRRRSLGDRVAVAGAYDVEPGWRGPRTSRSWVRGYVSRARAPYYDFGGAAGCPPYGSCVGAWTMEDVWYVAGGSGFALMLPEIYTASGASAEQWYRLSLYSVLRHGRPITFAGAMSQAAACRDAHDRCAGLRNAPWKAWGQLWRALNADPRTAQPLRWVTDIGHDA